jgi:hypothetical protein
MSYICFLQAAEERYSNEVVAHADSIKSVENLKQQLAGAQSSARNNLNATETARAKLTASESSWKQQKDALDKEVADLNSRYELLFPRIVPHNLAVPESRTSPSRTNCFISISTLLALRPLASDKPRSLRHLPSPKSILQTIRALSLQSCVPSCSIFERRRRSLTCSWSSANRRTRDSRARLNTSLIHWTKPGRHCQRYDHLPFFSFAVIVA